MPLTDEEMEHYLMFPEDYCRRCDGGRGPLCAKCEEIEHQERKNEVDMSQINYDIGGDN